MFWLSAGASPGTGTVTGAASPAQPPAPELCVSRRQQGWDSEPQQGRVPSPAVDAVPRKGRFGWRRCPSSSALPTTEGLCWSPDLKPAAHTFTLLQQFLPESLHTLSLRHSPHLSTAQHRWDGAAPPQSQRKGNLTLVLWLHSPIPAATRMAHRLCWASASLSWANLSPSPQTAGSTK